jgi:hypothetical protein
MSNSVADIIKQLDVLSNEEGVDIFVPSIKKTIKFKTLNLKQQKELLKTSIDENLVKISFNILLNNIIADNIIEPININSFYTFDRNAIAVSLRAKSLDNNYQQQDKLLNLEELINTFSTVEFDPSSLNTEIVENNITLLLKAPQLSIDREINTFSLNKIKSSNNSDVQTIIGDLVIYEFLKFISVIKVQDKEINLSALPIKERVSIIEKLPSNITNKVFNFIKEYRDLETKFVKFDDIVIDVDGSFFTI